jgi:hypothetical protein
MIDRKEISRAFDVSDISEAYTGPVEIIDLKDELGTKGHVLVVRGDKAYADALGENANLANPKFWLYENLINSPRVQEQLRYNPNHKLFDGVGFSSLEALGYHAKRLGRKAVVVMAHEHVPDKEVFERYDIEVIHGDKPAEEGYVEKQREVLSQRDDLIPLHQALYGAQALASIGNAVANRLEELCISPDETYWSMASGSNLYGIGTKIKDKFSSKTVLVEPKKERTVDPSLNLSSPEAVKLFAKNKLRNYSLDDWNRITSGIFPLHAEHPNRYLLVNWLGAGDTGVDSTTGISSGEVKKMQKKLRKLSPEYDWTPTTALPLVPAIRSANKGNNVLVMSYGKNRENKSRDVTLIDKIPWIIRNETPLQKVAASIALAGYLTAASYASYGIMFEDTPVFNGFAVVDKDGKTWVSNLVDKIEEK